MRSGNLRGKPYLDKIRRDNLHVTGVHLELVLVVVLEDVVIIGNALSADISEYHGDVKVHTMLCNIGFVILDFLKRVVPFVALRVCARCTT